MPSVSVYKEIEVDIDLDDFDDDDLREECVRRGIIDDLGQDEKSQQLMSVVQELQMNRQDQAMRLLEDLVYNCTGRIVVLR